MGFWNRTPAEQRWAELGKVAKRAGLSSDAVELYRTLMFWGEQLGYRAVSIVSGKRSSREQRRLRERWDAGDRRGMVVRPADNSAHETGDGFDLARSPHIAIYGQLARYYPGARWGGDFSTPDPVHFDLRG